MKVNFIIFFSISAPERVPAASGQTSAGKV